MRFILNGSDAIFANAVENSSIMPDGEDNFRGNGPPNAPQPVGPIRRVAGPPPVMKKNVAAQPIRRRFFLARVLLLCVRPEEWAEAGLYTLRNNIFAILLVILIATVAVATTCAMRVAGQVNALALHYPQTHAPMVLTDGSLKVIGPPTKLSSSLSLKSKTLNRRLVFSAKNGLRLEDYRGRNAAHLSQKVALSIQQMLDRALRRIDLATHQKAAPPPAKIGKGQIPQPIVINQHTIGRVAYAMKVYAGATAFFFAGMYVFFSDAVWAIFIVFLVSPIIFLINRENSMPRAVAQRIALATTAPLIMLSAVLHVLQISPEQVWPEYRDFIMAGWWIAAMGVAVWAGIIAKEMVAPARRRRVA